MKQKNKPHMIDVLSQSHRSRPLIKKLGWPIQNLTNIEHDVKLTIVSTTKRKKQRSVSKTTNKGQNNDKNK